MTDEKNEQNKTDTEMKEMKMQSQKIIKKVIQTKERKKLKKK